MTKPNNPLKKELAHAVDVLKRGGVIVFPTETSYGIGCDATNAKAVRRVFRVKGRPDGKGTPLIVDSLAAAERWGKFNLVARKLAKKYWPGPLTIVVPVTTPGVVSGLVLQGKTIALRVSSHPIARALARGLGRPLVATSANLSGEPACYSVRAFRRQIATAHSHHPQPLLKKEGRVSITKEVDVIVDVGALPRQKPTTLVRVVDDYIEILRQGKIKL